MLWLIELKRSALDFFGEFRMSSLLIFRYFKIIFANILTDHFTNRAEYFATTETREYLFSHDCERQHLYR